MTTLVIVFIALFLFVVFIIAAAEFIAHGVPVLPSEHSDVREIELI